MDCFGFIYLYYGEASNLWFVMGCSGTALCGRSSMISCTALHEIINLDLVVLSTKYVFSFVSCFRKIEDILCEYIVGHCTCPFFIGFHVFSLYCGFRRPLFRDVHIELIAFCHWFRACAVGFVVFGQWYLMV